MTIRNIDKQRKDDEVIKDIQEWLITGSILTNIFKTGKYQAAIVVNDHQNAETVIDALVEMKECLAIEYNNLRVFGNFTTKKERKKYIKSMKKQAKELIKHDRPTVTPPVPDDIKIVK